MSDTSNQTGSGVAASVGGGAAASAGMFASMVSAYIQCLDFPLPTITFSYNPDAYDDVTEAKWKFSTNPANNGSPPQFQGTVPAKMDVKILLDAFAMPAPLTMPTEVIETLKLMVMPTMDSAMAGHAAAPKVMFGWGANIIMPEAIVTKVAVRHERFLLGMPVRATATVTLQAFPLPAPLGGTNPTSGGRASRRTHTVVEGDTLASIAFREYKNPNRWRAIAEANGIDDPMRLKVGAVLAVPDRHEAENRS